MIICEQVLMTSLPLTPLCLLSHQQPAAIYGGYTTENLPYKEKRRVALCQTIGEGLHCLP